MLVRMDRSFIGLMRRLSMPFARAALFVVYFWFGLLKVIGASPASPLVIALQHRTMPTFSPNAFLIAFGVWEMVIGCAFLIPRAQRIALGLMVVHMVTTFLPLVLVPQAVWSGFFVPTLEGQYIIKNVALLAVAISIAAGLTPMERR